MRFLIGSIVTLVLTAGGTGALAQEVYFGNLHGHTSFSDGSGTPEDAFVAAKAAGMDFLAITEHNHDKADGKGVRKDGIMIATNPSLYSGSTNSLVAAAGAATKNNEFVALYGQEVSTISSGNHINVFDVPAVVNVTNGDVPALLDWVAANTTSSGQTAFLQFNHPRAGSGEPNDYGRDNYASELEWVEAVGAHVRLIEILNAPALKDGIGFRANAHQTEYLSYLNMGFHVGPSVGHDNHFRNWGTSTDARIGVIAASLTKTDILAALRARHTFASEDKNLKVIFRANGAIGGDIIQPPGPGSELDLTVDLNDPDELTAKYRIDVYMDEPGGIASKAPVETFKSVGNGQVRLDGVRFTSPGSYVFLRITQYGSDEDEDHELEDDHIWTAPVWFEFTAGPSTPIAAPSLRMASLIPDPVGDDTNAEEIELQNTGTQPVDLAGWTVRDLAQNIWDVGAGVLAPAGKITVQRRGQKMSMNNSGDTIELIGPSGAVVQTVSYGPVTSGQVISP